MDVGEAGDTSGRGSDVGPGEQCGLWDMMLEMWRYGNNKTEKTADEYDVQWPSDEQIDQAPVRSRTPW
jgi:hypothetical protein